MLGATWCGPEDRGKRCQLLKLNSCLFYQRQRRYHHCLSRTAKQVSRVRADVECAQCALYYRVVCSDLLCDIGRTLHFLRLYWARSTSGGVSSSGDFSVCCPRRNPSAQVQETVVERSLVSRHQSVGTVESVNWVLAGQTRVRSSSQERTQALLPTG